MKEKFNFSKKQQQHIHNKQTKNGFLIGRKNW